MAVDVVDVGIASRGAKAGGGGDIAGRWAQERRMVRWVGKVVVEVDGGIG